MDEDEYVGIGHKYDNTDSSYEGVGYLRDNEDEYVGIGHLYDNE